MKKAIEFLKKLSGETIILFHDDCDGVCSAAIILGYLKQKNIKTDIDCVELDIEEVKQAVSEEKDNIIFVDLVVDQFPEVLEPLKNKNVLVIDHHLINNDLNKIGILHINPRFENPDLYVSAASVCHEICKELGLKGFEWLARLGDVGDHVIEGNEEEKEAAKLISAIKAIKGKEYLPGAVKFLVGSNKIEEFIYKDEYKNLSDELEHEVERQITKFEKKEVGNVNFFEVKSNYSIISIVASAIFDKYPDKTIITYRKTNGLYNISGRSRKFDLGSIFKEVSEGIGRGGGHPVAAGAQINNMEEFKKRVLKLLS